MEGRKEVRVGINLNGGNEWQLSCTVSRVYNN